MYLEYVSRLQPSFSSGSMSSAPRVGVGLVRLSLSCQTRDASLLLAAAAAARDRLYVALRGDWSPLSVRCVQSRLRWVYQSVARTKPQLDVRVLLPSTADGAGVGGDGVAPVDGSAALGAPELDALLGEPEAEAELPTLNAVRGPLGLGALGFVPLTPDQAPHSALPAPPAVSADPPLRAYDHVCLGGTFDQLHAGHKMLLSLAAVCTSRRLVCGVSDAPLLRKKVCGALMQPLGLRTAVVDGFVSSVRPGLQLDLPPLQDGFGPAITDSSLQAIVVSAETLKGGDACNERRSAAGFAPLEVVELELVDEDGTHGDVDDEKKVSSTTKRKEQLGVMRGAMEAHWQRRSPHRTPYIIGLTGGVATGKSTAAGLLAATGSHAEVRVVGHIRAEEPAYGPESGLEPSVCKEAGERLVAQIDAAVSRYAASGEGGGEGGGPTPLLLVESSSLLEAGWGGLVDEVWCMHAPHALQLARLCSRDGVGADAAEASLASPPALRAEERATLAHVPLSSEFEESDLRAQLAAAAAGARRRAALRTLETCPADSVPGMFRHLCESHGVGEDARRRWWHALNVAHGEAGRRYHTLAHLEEMRRNAFGGSGGYVPRVGFAILFHDAVYDATRSDNEIRSAELWDKFASEAPALLAEDARAVHEWIVRTANHLDGPADGELATFLDADLAVLARCAALTPPHRTRVPGIQVSEIPAPPAWPRPPPPQPTGPHQPMPRTPNPFVTSTRTSRRPPFFEGALPCCTASSPARRSTTVAASLLRQLRLRRGAI